MGRIYAYGKAASRKEETDIRDALRKMQVQDCNIYIDTPSGNSGPYPRYAKLLTRLESGDLLCLASLSVLGDRVSEVKE